VAKGVLAIAIVLGCLFPLLGASMLAVCLFDAGVSLLARPSRTR
jgi:uncharacterized iron-regulated membrane protein